jgi:hypothetical protein
VRTVSNAMLCLNAMLVSSNPCAFNLLLLFFCTAQTQPDRGAPMARRAWPLTRKLSLLRNGYTVFLPPSTLQLAASSLCLVFTMAVVPLRFGVKFSPPTIALEHVTPDSSEEPQLLEVPLTPFLKQHNEDPASVVKALKTAFPEHFDPTVVSYKQVKLDRAQARAR